jgi:hypothetical protein
MVMAASGPQCARWIDGSSASESHWQPQLHAVRAVADLSGHHYRCVAASPGPTKRKRKRATGPRADVFAESQ